MSGTISALRVHHREVDLVRPFVTAIRRAASISVVLVEALDDDGHHGWGEAATSWRVTGESPASVRAAVQGPLAEVVVGRQIDDLATLGSDLARAAFQNSAARSAVECAVQDLSAASRGLTLAATLGAHRRSVRTDITLSATVTEDLVTLATRHVTDGFTMLKVKVGAGHNDRAAVLAVREAIGPAIGLRVDANQAWDVDEAVKIIRFWESAGVDLDFVEQPVRARDLKGLADVTARVTTPVLADESVRTSDDLLEIIDRRAATLVNIKIAKSGGLHEARRMAALAAHHGLGVVIGCMMESSVGVGAAAALAASLDETDAARIHDLDAGLWQATPVVYGGIRYNGPDLHLSDDPGLGIRGLVTNTSAIVGGGAQW